MKLLKLVILKRQNKYNMGIYTYIILIIPGMEDEDERIKEVNSFVWKNDHHLTLTCLNDTTRFPDFFPYSTYIGTYKNFPLEEFINHLKSVNWEYPEYVQMITKEEYDYTCKFYSNAGQKLEVDSIKM